MKRNGSFYWLCQGATWAAMTSYWVNRHGTLAVCMDVLSIAMLVFGAVNSYKADKERKWH